MSNDAARVVEVQVVGDIQVVDVVELGPESVGPPGPAGPPGPPGPPGTGADLTITSGPAPPGSGTAGRFYVQTGS